MTSTIKLFLSLQHYLLALRRDVRVDESITTQINSLSTVTLATLALTIIDDEYADGFHDPGSVCGLLYNE